MSSKDINQTPTDAAEDDDFGDFEGPEDDAPECVQGLGGPPTWVFPDLLRVQTNQTPHEEPESFSNSGQSRPHALPRNDMRGATGRETGAIPKQRALDPPDVSLLTNTSQSKMPSTLDLCSTAFSSNSYSRDNSSLSLTSQPSTSVLRPHIGSAHNGNLDTNNDAVRIRINQLESDLKQIQTQKQLLQQQLLQKDTQIRELQSQSRQSTLNSNPLQSQDSVIASLVESVDKFRSNVESAMSRLEQRLTSLETRVSETNLVSVGCDSSASNNSIDHQNGGQNMSQTLSNILAQQKKEVQNEKRQNLLLFSSILKNALEALDNHLDVNGHNCQENK